MSAMRRTREQLGRGRLVSTVLDPAIRAALIALHHRISADLSGQLALPPIGTVLRHPAELLSGIAPPEPTAILGGAPDHAAFRLFRQRRALTEPAQIIIGEPGRQHP